MVRRIALGFILLCLVAFGLKTQVALPGLWGYAPLNWGIGPGSQPIDLVVWYDREQHVWMEASARRFAASRPQVGGRPLNLRLVAMDSWDLVDRVVRQDWQGAPPPNVVMPASQLWLEELRVGWGTLNGGAIVAADEGTPLFLSPLVAVAWEDQAQRLWPAGQQRFWWDLHDALRDPDGWAGVVARAGFAEDSEQVAAAQRWGEVKLAFASPLRTNSGAQTLMLMAYGYYERTTGLTLADVRQAGLRQWLREIEQTLPALSESDAELMQNMAEFGPGRHDLIIVPEHIAMQQIEAAQSRWEQGLRMYYLPATIFSEYPYAILNAPLSRAEQRTAAERFRTFLRAREQQELARHYGFRPIAPAVPIMSGDPDNPFFRASPYGAQEALAQPVERPPREVLEALLGLWDERN
ncbi:MAG: ABC transporter substrate-binding protein [Candidatus Viridilinea halotolerans]|uniref:ABC transporter substrate-binding protein n=1 Tax=Candidatus Viridilinea halotolerans TaxID=2491704 RepID=A0A426U7I1_9CHLR|nr:MAG: ABC transporter substrate-binding protein [Candidatus Viridilinea halotolerans]